MNVRLDHIFILTEPGAVSGDKFVELGLKESAGRVHKGQGTANRRFEFTNSMLELLWVHDSAEATNGPGAGLQLVDRVASLDASPFGIILGAGDGNSGDLPFSGWQYQPDYFPQDMAFHIGANSRLLVEPLCIYAPFFNKTAVSKPGSESNGIFDAVTHVKLEVACDGLSDHLQVANKVRGLEVVASGEHLLQISFNFCRSGVKKDLRPELPLIFYW